MLELIATRMPEALRFMCSLSEAPYRYVEAATAAHADAGDAPAAAATAAAAEQQAAAAMGDGNTWLQQQQQQQKQLLQV